MLGEIAPLVEMGAAVHWLHARAKNPINNAWSTAPVATMDELRATYRDGYNAGIRFGEPSKVGAFYLQLIDIDIRSKKYAEEAWERVVEILPNARTLPFVISGSGGESRHLYFFCDKPLSSRMLARSAGFDMVYDADRKRDVKKRHWEIELYGTGKQAVIPPSIHPSGKPYVWGRPLDLEAIDMGVVPFISATHISDITPGLGYLDAKLTDLTPKPPLGLTIEESADILRALPLDEWCEDRDGWVQTGMALHHEYDGSEEAFGLWCEFSRQSAKFDAKNQRQVWNSFRGKPTAVRMATLKKAAKVAHFDKLFDDIDDAFEDNPEPEKPATTAPAAAAASVPEGLSELELELLETDEDGDPTAWRRNLDLTDDGGVRPTLHNVVLLFRHDPRTKGIASYNLFTKEVVQRRKPGRKNEKSRKVLKQLYGPIWDVKDPVNGSLWSESRDNAVREMVEAPMSQGGYGLKVSDRDLKAAIDIVARDNSFHPVQEYLESLTWDGTPRIDTLFVRYLGAPDTAYTRSIARLTLIAAVTRVYEPGHKFDFVPIMEGLQGKRKSTFIKVLANGWHSELEGDFSDSKRMVEKMQGAWIMEIPELSGFGKAEVQTIKAFVSREVDKDRLAYARRAEEFPRQCVFLGSTNDQEYLRDQTGGRRFWPVMCEVDQIDVDGLAKEIDQLWAEARRTYVEMRQRQPRGTLPLYLSEDEAAQEALIIQESRRVESSEDAMAGAIEMWLDTPVRQDDGFEDEDPAGAPVYRNETCLIEIWCDCLGRDRAAYDQRAAQVIGRALKMIPAWRMGTGKYTHPRYGRQRYYERVRYVAKEGKVLEYRGFMAGLAPGTSDISDLL